MKSELRYFFDIGRVQEITSATVANQALDEGWELLAIRDRTVVSQDRHGRATSTTAPVFVMGWQRPPPGRPAAAVAQEPSSAPSVREIKPQRPVPANNGPMGWLRRKLFPSVLRKHRDARIQMVEEDGLVRCVRISAPGDELDEIVNDVTSSIEWAFETVLADEPAPRQSTSDRAR